ncbi:hypothetical protein [Mycoplasmopsis cynos]|uniref:hypothetical protein n=1 Tax=Mycoplasmopsis cynos TaxID=171284 RepID=UPI003A5C7885
MVVVIQKDFNKQFKQKKELKLNQKTKTLATITYQNFFRMFKKLCGMTGTGKTEEQEFIDIYNMRVNVAPTNRPTVRVDEPDAIFACAEDKWNAVVNKIRIIWKRTTSFSWNIANWRFRNCT